jgi:hypothetical protein
MKIKIQFESFYIYFVLKLRESFTADQIFYQSPLKCEYLKKVETCTSNLNLFEFSILTKDNNSINSQHEVNNSSKIVKSGEVAFDWEKNTILLPKIMNNDQLFIENNQLLNTVGDITFCGQSLPVNEENQLGVKRVSYPEICKKLFNNSESIINVSLEQNFYSY